jgi:putative pyruvate formate lyase activating enzyme
MSALGLAQKMLALQNFGCHNINLVTPTHVVPQIVEALVTAVDRGLTIPLVYNCGGYESVATLRLLENIIDIYMPDVKYSEDRNSKRYSGAPGYWDVVRPAVMEMQRQVGDLLEDRNGVARRGLLVRHLVLPGRLAGSKAVIEFIAREISLDCYVNVMDQYRPSYRAEGIPVLNRRITADEFDEVIAYARKLGLHRGLAERAENTQWKIVVGK